MIDVLPGVDMGVRHTANSADVRGNVPVRLAVGGEAGMDTFLNFIGGGSLAQRRCDHAGSVATIPSVQLGPLEGECYSYEIEFIETTWNRFQMAQEINELYASGADGLFVTLKDMGLAPEREFLLREADEAYVVDLAIPCRDGTVAITLGERRGPVEALRFSSGILAPGGLDAITRAVERFGGAAPWK